MSPVLLLVIYCILIVGASLLGGWLPSLLRLTHTRLQLMMSGVGGLMLGIGLFHLLPHGVNEYVSLDRAIWWMMTGLLTTFFLIRIFHSHQHAPLEPSLGPAEDAAPDEGLVSSPAHGDGCHGHHHPTSGKNRWIGVFLGLSLHTLLDGAALAAGVLHDHEHSPDRLLFGFAVFLGILLHKPLDSLSITTLMTAGGWKPGTQQVVNFAYAAMCPVGAALFYLGVRETPQQDLIVGCALAFAAGIFVCISMGDLLPELEFHSHDRVKLTAALLVGVGVAYGIGYLEPDHVHSHSARPVDAEHHDHEAHDKDGHGHEDHRGHGHGHAH
jgi:zinc and cadmium transporter